MAQITFSFPDWQANYSYTKWDVAQGTSSTDSRLFFSLTDGNINYRPLARMIYTPTSSTRIDDVNRLYFTQTGTEYFKQGSIVEIANVSPDSTVNYSGVVLAGGPGYVDYLNPGLSVSNAISAGTVVAPIHPYWTTGFAWIPTWSTQVTHNMAVITAQMGEGYSQRQNSTINSNSLRWSLAFTDRTDKEARALLAFLQEKGGVGYFPMPFPVGNLYNNPNLKYVNGPASHTLGSYGLNNVSFDAQQVFDL